MRLCSSDLPNIPVRSSRPFLLLCAAQLLCNPASAKRQPMQASKLNDRDCRTRDCQPELLFDQNTTPCSVLI